MRSRADSPTRRLTRAISRPASSLAYHYARVGPPPPSGPLDLRSEADNGLATFSQPITITHPVLIVRVCGRNNAAAAPGMSWTLDGSPLTRAGAEIHDSTIGGPVAALYYITGLTNGAKTLACTMTGSAGRAAIRIGPLAALTGVGAIQSAIGTAQTFNVNLTPQNAGSDISMQAVWMDDRAFPVTASSGDTQFQATVTAVGAEMITNGAFAADTDWTKGISWTIGAGVANRNQATGGSILRQAVAGVVNGTRYRLAFDITATGGGTIQPFWLRGSWSLIAGAVSGVGHYEMAVTGMTSVTELGLQGSANPAPGISIDNVSLRPITAGVAAWFGRNPAFSVVSRQYTFDGSFSAPGAALVVELLGAVLP